ncbi:hypothetical protein AB0K51_27855 [Kitasatospora sp. NPDC049285]|uniref:hypothetical protein n=1 Tax=Kitasatospora sp. NPDC049285 TaxID=3157096 RepID=UPI00341DEF1D
MEQTTEEVLAELNRPGSVRVASSAVLAAKVGTAAAAIDRARARRAKSKGAAGEELARRKPGLVPLRGGGDLAITAWELLGVLARATALARQGRGRGIAEHWQILKYCAALGTDRLGTMRLSKGGQLPERSYRGMQARELGRAFGLAVAERAVRERFPDRIVSTVDAEPVLLAGFARSGKGLPNLGARPRPDYFIEAWRPGAPSQLFAVTVNGNHQVATKRTGATDRTSYNQLARGAERAENFQLAEWNDVPCLLLSTELLATDGITVHALRAPGGGLLPLRPAEGKGSADEPPRKRNPPYTNAVQVQPAEGRLGRVQDGFAIPAEYSAWFGRVVAHVGAASRLALAGGGRHIAWYLTEDQGSKHYDIDTFAGSHSIHDAESSFGDALYVGTDQVFRLGGLRVEAFSGMENSLYQLLAKHEVEEYRREAYRLRGELPSGGDEQWSAVSFGDDGSALAIRIVPDQGGAVQTLEADL